MQVEKIKNLQVKITAKDRQILSGELPQVFIAFNSAVYQVIYLRQLKNSLIFFDCIAKITNRRFFHEINSCVLKIFHKIQ